MQDREIHAGTDEFYDQRAGEVVRAHARNGAEDKRMMGYN